MQELQVNMDLFRNGDKATFEKVFHYYYRGLIFFMDSIIKDVNLAEDYVQDLFIKLNSKRGLLKEPKNIKAYLYISARNKCINYYRHSKLELEYIEHEKYKDQSEASDIFKEVVHAEIILHVYKAIELLPPKRKKCVILRLVEGYSYDELCTSLGSTQSTIKENIQKGKAFIKAYLMKNNISVDYLGLSYHKDIS